VEWPATEEFISLTAGLVEMLLAQRDDLIEIDVEVCSSQLQVVWFTRSDTRG
jgi:hypothetical protein